MTKEMEAAGAVVQLAKDQVAAALPAGWICAVVAMDNPDAPVEGNMASVVLASSAPSMDLIGVMGIALHDGAAMLASQGAGNA